MQVPFADLDIEAPEQLCAYLVQKRLIGPSEEVVVTRLKGGVSGRTVLVERANGERWVVKQALPALRVEVAWLSSPARSRREAEGARALATLLPPGSVPRVLFEDSGCHLFVMAAADASAKDWKSLLLAGKVNLNHFAKAGEMLARIHRGSAGRASEFAPVFGDLTYFESLRLEPYYRYAGEREPRAAAFLDSLIKRARTHAVSLVHGDFSPKNLLVAGDAMVLLDHEVIHFGDPAFDVGFVFAHFLSKAHHLPASRAALVEGAAQFWRSYQDASDVSEDGGRFAAAHALGCLLARVAGRSQLEYLTAAEKARQRTACLRLIQAPPAPITELPARFLAEVG